MADNPVLAALRERRSIRKYTAEPVSDEQIEALLEAARWAPSGLNNQPWRFMAVSGGERLRERLAGCTKYGHIVRTAPLLVAVLLHRPTMYSEIKDHQAVGGAIQNMLLAAHAMGLGAVWLGEIINQAGAVLDVLGLDPGEYELQAVIAAGHPDQKGSSDRKPLADLLLTPPKDDQ